MNDQKMNSKQVMKKLTTEFTEEKRGHRVKPFRDILAAKVRQKGSVICCVNVEAI